MRAANDSWLGSRALEALVLESLLDTPFLARSQLFPNRPAAELIGTGKLLMSFARARGGSALGGVLLLAHAHLEVGEIVHVPTVAWVFIVRDT